MSGSDRRQAIAHDSGLKFQPGCSGKRQYRNKRELKGALKSMRARGVTGDLFHYHCLSCGFWHFTRERQGHNGAPVS